MSQMGVASNAVALEVGANHATISRIRRAERRPSQPLAVRICEVLEPHCDFPLSVEDIWPYKLGAKRKGTRRSKGRGART